MSKNNITYLILMIYERNSTNLEILIRLHKYQIKQKHL